MHPHRPARVCTITQAAPPKLPWCSKQLPKVAVQLSTLHFLTTTTQLWWPMGFQEISKNNTFKCSSTIQVRMWSSKRVKIPQFLVMIREEYVLIVILRYTLCLDSCDLYSHETIFCSLVFVISFRKLQCFWRSCVPFLDHLIELQGFTTALPQAHPKNTQVPFDFLSSASDCRSAEDLPVKQNDAKCFKAPWFSHLFICF